MVLLEALQGRIGEHGTSHLTELDKECTRLGPAEGWEDGCRRSKQRKKKADWHTEPAIDELYYTDVHKVRTTKKFSYAYGSVVPQRSVNDA